MKRRAIALYAVVMALVLSVPIAFTNAQNMPHISSISPDSATYGTQIMIVGTGFDRQNNDIGFMKSTQGKVKGDYDTGYINNVPSKDGKTLVFELPEAVAVCAFSTMESDEVCVDIALMLDEGEYDVFVVNKNGKSNTLTFRIASELFMKKIQTRVGELTLSYKDGFATLGGILERSTPCVNWEIKITGTEDVPPSHVEFHIFDSNKGTVCIQVLGDPQMIKASSRAGKHTFYRVFLEDMMVFSGKLTDSSEKQVKGDLYVKAFGEIGNLLTSWDYKDRKGIIILFSDEIRIVIRLTLSGSTCLHPSEECIEGVVTASNSATYGRESKIHLEIDRTGTLYLALIDDFTPQVEYSFSINKMRSIVIVNEGQRKGPLLVEQTFPDHIVGLNFPEYPVPMEKGLPVTLRIGETVSNGCTVRLKLLEIRGDSATFLKTVELKEICPICWHNKMK